MKIYLINNQNTVNMIYKFHSLILNKVRNKIILTINNLITNFKLVSDILLLFFKFNITIT